jgi:hypothetical protein
MNKKTYLIYPDFQIPYHDVSYVQNLIKLAGDLHPDGVVFIGDNIDCLAPATWSSGTAAEFAGTLQNELDVWAGVATSLRKVYDGWVGVHMGNHEKRITSYLNKKAPAFSSLRSLKLEELMGLKGFDFERLPDHYDIAPGWVTHHGDYCSLSDIAGRTASNYSSKIGKSVIIGHTHRAGIIAESTGYNSSWKWTYGVEVGHAMDTTKAGYTNGVANWQKAFGVLEVYDNGEFIQPRVIFASPEGRFVFDGVAYGW